MPTKDQYSSIFEQAANLGIPTGGRNTTAVVTGGAIDPAGPDNAKVKKKIVLNPKGPLNSVNKKRAAEAEALRMSK